MMISVRMIIDITRDEQPRVETIVETSVGRFVADGEGIVESIAAIAKKLPEGITRSDLLLFVFGKEDLFPGATD